MKRGENEPTDQEANVLLALDPGGTAQAELCKTFGLSSTSNFVRRLKAKGLVKEGGLVHRHQAPPSKLIVPTDQGKQVIALLRQRSARR